MGPERATTSSYGDSTRMLVPESGDLKIAAIMAESLAMSEVFMTPSKWSRSPRLSAPLMLSRAMNQVIPSAAQRRRQCKPRGGRGWPDERRAP